MEPTTLSATAIKTFESCEAMFKAQYVDRVREASGAAADLGTAVHDTLEWFVSEWIPANDGDPKAESDLLEHFEHHAARYGLDSTMVKDGRKMLAEWLGRWEENPPHEVLSTELKESFTIKSSDGHEIDVVYIWDRGDRHEDGTIEVIDYKTWRKVMDAEEMRRTLQVRLYALSAMIKYKQAKPAAIWVTYDQMRTTPVSVKFTRDDNLATWNYLKRVYDRILASDGSRETVNEDCRYCPRKATCPTLDAAITSGNIQRLRAQPEQAALRLAQLKAAKNAMETMMSELEEFMEELLEEHGVPELSFDTGVVVKMTVRRNRKPEMERIAKLIGPELMAKYGKMGLTDIDELLKGDEIDEELKIEIQRHIKTTATGKATAVFKK